MLARFYPIVDSAAFVQRMTNAGAKLVQLRIKDQDLPRVRAEISAAKKICQAAGAQLIINDYWQVALEEQCDFIHLGQQDLASADLAAIRKASMNSASARTHMKSCSAPLKQNRIISPWGLSMKRR